MVETYIESELQDLITDAEKTDEWRKKVEELGLRGQLSLIEGKKSPIPFPIMNRAMQRVYETLCPAKMEVKEYNRTTIPARVLEMIGLCVKENYFSKLWVWFDDESPDPILVGRHAGALYLIARWGDELRSFSELRELARTKKIEDGKRKLTSWLASLERDVDEYLDGFGWLHW